MHIHFLNITVTAVDGDRGVDNKIVYSFNSNNIGKESDIFTIDKNTGLVSTSRKLDRESISSSSGAYILQITVRNRVF